MDSSQIFNAGYKRVINTHEIGPQSPVGLSMETLFDKDQSKCIGQFVESIAPLKMSRDFRNYHITTLKVTGYMNYRGRFRPQRCSGNINDDLKNKIIHYIESQKFHEFSIPRRYEKRYYVIKGYFRHENDSIARHQKILKMEEKKLEILNNAGLDSIDGIYIPKNLEESIRELDKTIQFSIKQELKDSNVRSFLFGHIGSLGIGIRNNWGLRIGSRLQKYFNLRGIEDPDEMSEIISKKFQGWLITGQDTWTEWEQQNPQLGTAD